MSSSVEKGESFNTGDSELDYELELWFKWDKNEKSRLEIRSLYDEGKLDELRKLLLSRMEFGTAGLRNRMGAGNSQMNDLTIIQTTQGLASYLKESLPDCMDKGVVVGFDGRHNSYKWSRIVGSIFANAGIPLYLFSRLCPTPYVAYACRLYKASCGVMVTASHNPKEDNGYKVYWDNGAQIISPVDKGIAQAIRDNLEPLASSWDTSVLTKECKTVRDPMEEVIKNYNTDILQLCYTRESNEQCPVRFTYTAMHGVGYEFVKLALQAFNFRDPIPVEEQVQPDPEFPTVKLPNPEEGKGALKLAFATADKNRSKVIIANDPDADRLAIAESTDSGWKVFSGNEIGTFLSWWCWYCWRAKNPEANLSNVYMMSSTVSSKILEAIAKVEGFNFVETLTGFKWMGNMTDRLLKEGKTVLFAFEEAIGFMCGSVVLDKDGLSSAAMVGELVNHLYSTGSSLTSQLDIIYKKYGYHLASTNYFLCHDPPTTKAMFERLRNFDGSGKYPSKCGKFAISGVRDLTVGYDTDTPDNIPLLPSSMSSQMITFKFENGCVLTLRTSGTEPKIKYYIELRPDVSKGVTHQEAKKELEEMVKEVEEHFYNLKKFPKILPRQS